MLTINFPRHDPSSRTLDALPARDLTHTAPAQPGNGEPGVACSASDFPHTGALGYANIWRRPPLLLGNVRDLSGGSDWSVRRIGTPLAGGCCAVWQSSLLSRMERTEP
jgi:hypothetical protein